MAINDFGEKIGGAKKDLWKSRGMILEDLSEMNAAEKLKLIKKDNVWQKPDYAELVANGLPIKVAYFIKTVRDSLPAKPILTSRDKSQEQILDKQEKYIQFVGNVRDAVMNCKTEEDILRVGNQKWLAENGYIDSERSSSYRVYVTDVAGDVITNKFLKYFCVSAYDLRWYDKEIERKQFLYSDEQKILSKYDFFKYTNVTWNKSYNDRIMFELKVGGTWFMYPKGEFADEQSWKLDTYFVLDKSHNIIARNFETKEEAQKFVIDRESGKEVEKPKKKGKSRFVPVQLEHIKRNGDDVRHGRSMTGQDYLKVFGFKGGEFGNWMSEKDRQASLNYGYEALYDLAKALKIDLKDISLGNSLSIAFGARGSGSALAHYEPLREVINLTKMRGAGSLAHEWGHALDDIIGKRLGLPGFMTAANSFDKKVPASLINLVDKMRYKEAINDDLVASRKLDAEQYASRLRGSLDSYFPCYSMTAEQIARKDELVEGYLDNAVNVDSSYFTYRETGKGNFYIDALSDLRKELTGMTIPKDARVLLADYQNTLRARLQNINKPQKVKTTFYENSIAFDKQHSKTDNGYWQSTEEMFARAFACYVSDKIEGRSDYLCGHANLALTKIRIPDTLDYDVLKAFPEDEEREAINQCFDELIQELKDMNLLHHKEEFSIETPREREEPQWDRLPETEEEAYPVTLLDLLSDAYERSDNSISGEQMSLNFEKEIN